MGPRRQDELDDVEERIRECEKLIVEQQARIARVRELGWDTVVSLRFLGQLEFSLRLLANTRELIRREMPGIKVPSRARLAWPLAPDEIVALIQKQ